jgi:hypothetical protein
MGSGLRVAIDTDLAPGLLYRRRREVLLLKKTLQIVSVLILLGAFTPLPRVTGAEQGVQVIVNASSSVSELERDEVVRLFLRQRLKWSDGRAVAPVDQSVRSSVRDAFSSAVLRMPLPAVQAFWQRQLSFGGGTPPPVKASEAEVLAFVAGEPGAIGYISSELNLTPGVKAVQVRR